MSRVFPLILALSSNTKNGDGGPELGEREQIVATLTEGGTSGDSGPEGRRGPELLPLMPPWATV